MKKTHLQANYLLKMIFAFIGIHLWFNANAQSISPPTNYISLGTNDTCFYLDTTSYDTWYRYTASDVVTEINLTELDFADYDSITIWRTTGGTITYMSGSQSTALNLNLIQSGLSTSSVYWFKVHKVSTNKKKAAICIDQRSTTTPMICNGCPSALYDSTNTCEQVCNGHFDYNTAQPFGLNLLIYACPWHKPVNSPSSQVTTPDYHSDSASSNAVGVPSNVWGWQNSFTPSQGFGYTGYAGILTYWGGDAASPADPDTREYVQAPLNSTLLNGKQYQVSFRISKADKSKWVSKNIGAYVSNGAPGQSSGDYIPISLANVQALITTYVTDTANWILVSGVFTSNGTENTITIGSFSSDAASVTSSTNYSGTGINAAYYYIDDVSLVPYPDSIDVYAAPNPVCAGDTVTLHSVTNVSNPYYLTWLGKPSASAGILYNNNDTIKTIPTDTVTYKNVIHLAGYGGCTINDTIQVIWKPGPLTVDAGLDQTICLGGSDTLTGSATGIYDQGSWALLTGGNICTNCTTIIVNPTTTTEYVFTMTNTTTGCFRRDTVKVTVTPLVPTIVIPVGATTCAGCFDFTTAIPYSSYFWSTNAVTSSGGTTSTLNACWGAPYDTSGLSGNVSVSVVDANGCQGSVYISVPSCCPFKEGDENSYPNLINDSTTRVDNVTYPSLYAYNAANQYYEATNQQFSINGLYVVDKNTRWMGCEVKMGPDAKILLRPGIKFEITNSTGTNFTKIYACTDMWDGIYVDGTNAATKFTMLNGSVIEDAKNAVVSTNGGNYFIDGGSYTCKFNKNNIGILVKAYTGAHPGLIRKAIFACDAPGQPGSTSGVTFSGANCRAPVSGKGFAGVYIENCTDVIVGDSTASGYRNLFERTQYGIYATLSNVKVWNNDFKYFTNTVVGKKVLPNGIAVYMTASKFTPKTGTVGRQGNYKAKNKFTKCSFGVYVYNYINLNCEFNRFDSCMAAGITTRHCQNRTILINADTLTECTGTNIQCIQSTSSTITITYNSINSSSPFVAGNFGNTGIYVAQAAITPVNLKIQFNSIRKMRNGIWVSRVDKCRITDNTPISFMTGQPMSQVSPCIGIKLEEVTNSMVRQNSVSMQSSPTSAVHDKIFGVHMTNCKNDTITKNTFSRMGSAIFLKGANNPSILACNTMTTCWFGVNFNYLNNWGTPVSVNDQITWTSANTPYATGNTWGGGSLGSDIKGTIMPINLNGIKWYYPTAAYNPSISLTPSSFFNNATQSTSNGDRCSYMLAPPTQTPAGIRDYALGGICVSQRSYDTLEAEYQYHDKVFAYRMLRDNPSWKSLGTDEDSYYSDFYTAYSSENIGLFADVEDSIVTGGVASATSILASITPSGQYEINRKALLEVYLQTWAVDDMFLDSIQEAVLLSIVNQGTLVGGTTVFDARNMLGLELHDSSVVRMQNPIYAASIPNIVSPAYPNPSNGQVSIDVSLPENVPAAFELFDLSGRLVSAWQFVGGQGQYTFDASFVPSGTYIYRVRTEGEMLKSDRLVIIKD